MRLKSLFHKYLILPWIFLLLVFIFFANLIFPFLPKPTSENVTLPLPFVAPTPTPFLTYTPPTVPKKESYTIFLLGDSMTAALGKHSDLLSDYLKAIYPGTVWGLFNYSSPSTSILTLNDRLNLPTSNFDQTMPPVLERTYDIVIIESFAYNPLSDLPLTEGLKKQEEVLNQVIPKIIDHQPNSLIILLATIAPSLTHYGSTTIGKFGAQQSYQSALERRAYLENFINYASRKSLPLIDLYHQSLSADGQANLAYINPDDYIHPSAEGLHFIARSIADFLSRYIPK